MNRRDLLRGVALAGGVFVGAGLAHGVARGLRFPGLQFEPTPLPRRLRLLDPGADIDMDGAYLQDAERTAEGLSLKLRAFGPQPGLTIGVSRAMVLDLLLSNVSPRAEIIHSADVTVRENRLTPVNRSLRLQLSPGLHHVRTSVPFEDAFRFTVIGDSGGGSELRWCLRRSADLGADFVLHLGDLYYSDADFISLARTLDDSPLPVFASIGNHDFQRGGRFIHRDFTREVGPRNFFFPLAETMLVNFDTSASIWPVGLGERAAMFKALAPYRGRFEHWILMTHKPVHDPRYPAESDLSHALNSRETGWVLERLKELTAKPVLLAGHIHISEEHEEDGIETWISGEGLGSRNLVSGREIARILVGEKRPGEAVGYRWQPLEMPVHAYCHNENRKTLDMSGKPAPPGSFGSSCPKDS